MQAREVYNWLKAFKKFQKASRDSEHTDTATAWELLSEANALLSEVESAMEAEYNRGYERGRLDYEDKP